MREAEWCTVKKKLVREKWHEARCESKKAAQRKKKPVRKKQYEAG